MHNKHNINSFRKNHVWAFSSLILVSSVISKEALHSSQWRWWIHTEGDICIFLKYSSSIWKIKASMWLLNSYAKNVIKILIFPSVGNKKYFTQLRKLGMFFRFQRSRLAPETFQVRASNRHENQNQLVTKAQKGGACVWGKFYQNWVKGGNSCFCS